METTLAERLKQAMAGPPKVSGVELAKACGVAPPSVSGWRTGDSKSLEGSNLLAAAKRLGVRAEWLADGIGPMRNSDVVANKTHAAHEPTPERPWNWPFTNVTVKQWASLDNDQKLEIEKYVVLQLRTIDPKSKHRAPANIIPEVRSA